MSTLASIALLVIGVFVFACSLFALRRAEVFGAGGRLALAVCTAVLSVIALLRMIGQQHGAPESPAHVETHADGVINGLLVPYVALAVTLVLLPFLILVLICLRKAKAAWVSATRKFRRLYRLTESDKEATRNRPAARNNGFCDDERQTIVWPSSWTNKHTSDRERTRKESGREQKR